MAKTGIYKSDVKKARDSIMAQNKHPSVDAIRIALGNTGSKSTIHKYLKELEAENAHSHTTVASISEAIQNLISNLANQLVTEADARVEELSLALQQREKKLESDLNTSNANNAELHTLIENLQSQIKLLNQTIEDQRDKLHDKMLALHTSKQRSKDLEELLTQSKKHVQSLEEKHMHAREALEHYRQSVKEQRDQESRKHDNQIQQLQAEVRILQQTISVKAEEIMRLNREGAIVVTDLSHAKNTLYEEERQKKLLLEELANLERLNQEYGFQLQDRDSKLVDFKTNLEKSGEAIAVLTEEKVALEKELIAMQATHKAHQSIGEDFRKFIKQGQVE